MDNERWVTLAEAAEETGVTVDALRRRIRRGRLESGLAGQDNEERPATLTGQSGVNAVRGGRTGVDIAPLVELIDRLQTEHRSTVEEKDRTILELAGRCGYYQAENEQLKTTLKALQAPQPELTPMEPASALETAEEPPRGPWRRLWRWMLATG